MTEAQSFTTGGNLSDILIRMSQVLLAFSISFFSLIICVEDDYPWDAKLEKAIDGLLSCYNISDASLVSCSSSIHYTSYLLRPNNELTTHGEDWWMGERVNRKRGHLLGASKGGIAGKFGRITVKCFGYTGCSIDT
ncbi:hypothetical protein ACP70R_039167 [Stipagrostis hirtigluma subsp. patula]